MIAIPDELKAYHAAGKPLVCEIPVQPWNCMFWPIEEIDAYNRNYEIAQYAPGYLGFATSGGGEMYTISPTGTIVCLAFIGMSPDEELPVADFWVAFERMLKAR